MTYSSRVDTTRTQRQTEIAESERSLEWMKIFTWPRNPNLKTLTLKTHNPDPVSTLFSKYFWGWTTLNVVFCVICYLMSQCWFFWRYFLVSKLVHKYCHPNLLLVHSFLLLYKNFNCNLNNFVMKVCHRWLKFEWKVNCKWLVFALLKINNAQKFYKDDK